MSWRLMSHRSYFERPERKFLPFRASNRVLRSLDSRESVSRVSDLTPHNLDRVSRVIRTMMFCEARNRGTGSIADDSRTS